MPDQPDLFSTTTSTPSQQDSASPTPAKSQVIKSPKLSYQQRFRKAYSALNAEQREAVDRIEGPVLVNAGPGTGKTQILAIRIGKILIEQDVAPHNILCLTFTDAAVIAMRNRLVQFIGPDAHKVHIQTFHGFCNQVIQENMDIFGDYRKLEPITELESIDVFRELIDSFPSGHKLKRYKYGRYSDAPKLKHLFELMKKENLTAQDIHDRVDTFLEEKKEKGEYLAKSNRAKHKVTKEVFSKGDFRDDLYDIDVEKYGKLKLAANEFDKFKQMMDVKERYDFNDMILWVLQEFQKNDHLLSSYQERYQYFLVDEFQDTNGAQNDLLEALISFWEDQANIFVVGDDDQAIYKFQGANLDNIVDFKDKHNPHVIVLKDNYRSNQLILDKSKTLIENNTERLISKIENLSKELIAKGKYSKDQTRPKILSFDKISAEYAYIAKQMEDIHLNNPSLLNKVAVIYRNHSQVSDLVTVLEKKNIPINIRRKVNILDLPLIKNLIQILSYLSEEYNRYGSGQHRLFEILHYQYFGIDSLDLGKIALHCKKRAIENEATKWREVIADKDILSSLNLKNPEAVLIVSAMLDTWITESSVQTLQNTFEQVINEGGVLDHIMSGANRAWNLQVISTFFDLIKNETAKNPKLDLKNLLAMIVKMEENRIPLPINKIISSEDGVNLITAHSAKGLEFHTVYMLGCTKNIWDNKKGNWGQYSFPDTLNGDTETNDEDERRLFYVAITRAEKELFITYSDKNETDKDLSVSKFVTEIRQDDEDVKDSVAVEEDTIAQFYYQLLHRKQQKLPLIDKDLIDAWMKGYKLSVTHLNKYLRCPITFYFEAILRVPGARNASSGFGSAIHDTLQAFFNKIRDPEHQSASKLEFLYEEKLKGYRSHFTDEEFENYLDYGKIILKDLHKEQLEAWLQVPNYGIETPINNAQYKGIPLKGVLDKVEIHKDHVNVVDYKTGKQKPEKIKRKSDKPEDIGGDYWRQLVFYKLLLDSDKKHNWNMVAGKVQYLEPDQYSKKFVTKEVLITSEDLQTVGTQIVETFEAIKSYKFDTTCTDQKCKWCQFATENYPMMAVEAGDGKEVLEVE